MPSFWGSDGQLVDGRFEISGSTATDFASLGSFTVTAGTSAVIFVRDWGRYRRGSLFFKKTAGTLVLTGSLVTGQWCETISAGSSAFGTPENSNVDASSRGYLFVETKGKFIKMFVNNTSGTDDVIVLVYERTMYN